MWVFGSLGWLVILVPLVTYSQSLSRCALRDITFELITGFVFTAPDYILNTQPGTLQLSDCIAGCQQNHTCRAVNYETGLCVTFSTSSKEFPRSLAVSVFPVFTVYAEKVCVPTLAPPCGRPWAYEVVRGFQLKGFTRMRQKVGSREECMRICLDQQDFVCRSANYNPSTGDCSISNIDRLNAPSFSSFQPSPSLEYLETNCVDDPARLCDYKKVPGRILKTVDSVYENVDSLATCKKLCSAANYRCHSYDYGDTGDQICRLSHHNSATLRPIKEPFLEIKGVATYEMGACYNVTVDCRGSSMVAQVRTSKMFNGKMYSKTQPNSCLVDVSNSLEFELLLQYNDINCAVAPDSRGRYATDIIIQHHDMIVTNADIGLQVRCNYNIHNTTVTNGLKLN